MAYKMTKALQYWTASLVAASRTRPRRRGRPARRVRRPPRLKRGLDNVRGRPRPPSAAAAAAAAAAASDGDMAEVGHLVTHKDVRMVIWSLYTGNKTIGHNW